MQDGIRLAGPSRELPLASKLQFIFGGFYAQFGWAWFGFSSIHLRLFLGLGAKGLELLPSLALGCFPFIGLAFIAVGLRKGLRALRLLRNGIYTQGRLVGEQATAVQINDTTVMAMTFEFKTVDGRSARCVANTHLVHDLKDDAEEPLVYAPEDPSVAVLLDELPGKPRINADTVVLSREGFVWHLLLLPGATVLLHLVWTLSAR